MTLAQLNITNGEAATITTLAEFLAWMNAESITTPADRKELNALLVRWIQHDRRQQMRRISELRISRGQSPLPAYLTRAPRCRVCDGDGKIMESTGNPKRPLRARRCPECG